VFCTAEHGQQSFEENLEYIVARKPYALKLRMASANIALDPDVIARTDQVGCPWQLINTTL
jgi:hypothetical protein